MRIHCLQNEKCLLAKQVMQKRFFTQSKLAILSHFVFDLLTHSLAHDQEAFIYALFCATLRHLNEFQRLNVLANVFNEFNIEVRTLAQYKRKHELKTHNCYR